MSFESYVARGGPRIGRARTFCREVVLDADNLDQLISKVIARSFGLRMDMAVVREPFVSVPQ
jgi:hypothetical protein